MPKEIYDDVAQLKVLISHLPPLRLLFNDSSFAIHYPSPFNKGIFGDTIAAPPLAGGRTPLVMVRVYLKPGFWKCHGEMGLRQVE